MPKIDLVIWDWNGTLQDDLDHIYECGVQRIFREFNLPCPTVDEYRREVSADFMKTFYWPHGVPRNVGEDHLNKIMSDGLKAKGVPAPAFPDALTAVYETRRRGAACALVSGYASAKLTEAVKRHGFAALFYETKGDVRDKVAEFHRLIFEAGSDPSTVACVGDTVEDAEAAAAVGALPIICPRGFHPRERIESLRASIPTLVIVDDLASVPNLIA